MKSHWQLWIPVSVASFTNRIFCSCSCVTCNLLLLSSVRIRVLADLEILRQQHPSIQEELAAADPAVNEPAAQAEISSR